MIANNFKMLNRCLMLVLLLAGAVSVNAQQKAQLNGIVTTESGDPLSSVSISVILVNSKDTQSLSSNDKGLFSVTNLQPGSKYHFSFSHVGFQVQTVKNFEIRVGVNNSIIIRMKEQPAGLNEIVVIGYGSVKKKDLTGALSSVKGSKANEVAAGDVTNVLQGRAAGVLVQTQSWKPGSNAQVRIRGYRSINGDNEPLYVVDGVPMVDAISMVSPNDIESFEILKDASATAIYGNRGSNGVILITTKKGKKGRSIVEYNGYYGIQKNQPLPELMSAAEFVEYSREAQRNALGGTYDGKPNKELDFKNEQLVATPYMQENMKRAWASGTYDPSQLTTTDWLDYGLRQGTIQDHQLSVRGGSDQTRFLLSANYFGNTGVVRDQDYQRYSVRLNAEHDIRKNIRIGTQMSYANSALNAGWSDVFDGYGLKSFNPLASPYNADGTLAMFPTNNTRTPNPVTNFGKTKRLRKQDRMLGNFFLEVDLLKDLRFRSNLALDYRASQYFDFNSENTAVAGGQAPSSAVNASERKFMYTLENILSYTGNIGEDHSLYATVVQSIQSEKIESNKIDVKELPYDGQLYYNVGSALTINGVNSNLSEWALASYMGRINYGYKGKYLATVSARWDGSSRLAAGRQWVIFPSVALAWRLKNEPFLQNSKLISDLKLRLGWGRTGNSGIAPYKTWGRLNTIRYAFGDASALGYTPVEMINPNLTWETTDAYNAGVDLSLVDGRISGSIEAYVQNTFDLLLDRQLPTVSGFGSILSNVGKTRNKGIELTLNTVNVRQRNFEWRSDWIFSLNKQEIVELYNGKKDDVGAGWFIGKPINVYYDLGFNGIWQNTDADKAAMAKFNTNGSTFKPGDIRPVDRNGDFKIDANDRYIIGQRDPKWTASWANNFRYKDFDLSVFLVGMFGQTVNHDMDMRFDGRYNQPKLDYWTPANASSKYPRPLLGTAGLNYVSTLNYYSGSFVRVKNISLGYTLPAKLAKRAFLEKCRIYASVQNPFLITKFPGTDPEGATGFDEPSVVTGLIGVNISF
ncbi:TonB-dependent receptor [Pseudoflavitalea sp. G-6-1-2]|uniref:SusC/RagA family TonB-linked outer membrane protein n=1 Tax=Pseudoflavitalea sp. G-6-1-2 TaxID=2728841 RepID=UPI00146F9422|nr:TonB-dependent receptor [Pseudoflavitalea sp. G-6-1-2]NML20808.1 TonB-dependent receptor [Pseudoflavitalea sp. G-6-1-2]